MHGVPLTEQVIAAVRRDPAAGALPYLLPHVNVPWVEGGVANPMAEDLLADAAFPSGRPLSPSLRAWLAYDMSLLERHKWFTPDGDFAPRPLDQLVGDEMGDFWGAEFAWLSGRFSECFLLPGGLDSRRILAVTDPDEEGSTRCSPSTWTTCPTWGSCTRASTSIWPTRRACWAWANGRRIRI